MGDVVAESQTPPQRCLALTGAILFGAGILGFFYSTGFGTPGGTENVLGVFEVNGWLNLAHLVTGAVALAMMGRAAMARTAALVLGAGYLAVAIRGFVVEDSILGLGVHNTADNVLHAALGILGLVAAATSKPPGTRATRAARA